MGHVFWITGLPGSGKTSISRLFYNRLRATKENVVLLDGDELRSVLGIAGHYSYEERKQVAFIYCRLCKMLADQGITIVIATVSMFHDCHSWNREMLSHYHEIYLRTPKEILLQRNQKGLFSAGVQNVVGADIPFEEPRQPDLILENNGDFSTEEMEEQLNASITRYLVEKV